MTISANTLFHFTSSLDNLISILKHEFRPQYHVEDTFLSFKPYRVKGMRIKAIWAVPMVCFCDLPLSLVKDHMEKYGCYAIGMSKKWGIKKGLNPIMYLCKDSDLASYLRIAQKKLHKTFSKIEAHIKIYEDQESLIRYYDEREWRYVPRDLRKEDLTVGPAIFTNPKRLRLANQKVGDKYTLNFGPKDIKYIVIKSEKERLSIIEAIEEAKNKYDFRIVRQLSSRILSSKQIKEDF